MTSTLENTIATIRAGLPRLQRGPSFNHAGIAPQPLSDAVQIAERMRAERPYTELFEHVTGVTKRIRAALTAFCMPCRERPRCAIPKTCAASS